MVDLCTMQKKLSTLTLLKVKQYAIYRAFSLAGKLCLYGIYQALSINLEPIV